MITNNDENNDERVDFNEFQSLMDRDIRTLTNSELSSGHPLVFFIIAWQRRTLMARLMQDMALSRDDIRILKQARRLAAECRDRDAAEQVDRYWQDQERIARSHHGQDDAAAADGDYGRRLDGAEQHAFERLHERLYKNGTFRRFRGPDRVTLLEVSHKVRISRQLLGLYGGGARPRTPPAPAEASP